MIKDESNQQFYVFVMFWTMLVFLSRESSQKPNPFCDVCTSESTIM